MSETLSYVALDGERHALDLAELDRFRARHRGPVSLPGSERYEAACTIWNAMIEARPALVARPTGVADVVEAVRLAGQARMLTAIRAGGHNVSGSALVDGGLVIDMTGMRHVQVDPVRRRAWVGGGATLGDVDRETQLHGLAAPLGAVSQTGVAGLTLGGGYGWLRARFGLACDAVRTFEVVTADGRLVRASEGEHPDLFWALRGGGGNFGIVTGFEFELYPVGPEVLLVGVAHPIERTREAVGLWSEVMAGAPPELETNVLIWTLPEVDAFPAEARGRDVCLLGGCWTGAVDEGLEAVRPFRELGTPVLDLTSAASWCDVQTAFDDLFRPGERRNYWKSRYVDRIDSAMIDLLARKAEARPDPWALIGAYSLRGQCREQPPGGSAMGDRDAPWLVSVDTSWIDAAKDEECLAWSRELWRELGAWSDSGGGYLNFAGFGEEREALLRASYGEEAFARLGRVKAEWDPENFFRTNLNVRPSSARQSPA